jgi:hypothetical protein
LIEHLAYSNSETNSVITVTIYDRLIAGGYEEEGDYSHLFLYVRDQQPALLGASYQYFVVRLNSQREISETIPAGTVTIPISP